MDHVHGDFITSFFRNQTLIMLKIPYTIILASKSPRRQELLIGLDIEFRIVTKETDEEFPSSLKAADIALYLSQKKSHAFSDNELPENYLLISADTIVWINDHVMNKPQDREEAVSMLRELSGQCHKVFTGITIRTKSNEVSFIGESNVWFSQLTDEEIAYYIDTYRPYDKAGSYGVQEWIGYCAIERIEGSQFNVMGLPVQQLYKALKDNFSTNQNQAV